MSQLQRWHHKFETGGLKSSLVTNEEPPWLVPTGKKIFENKPSRMAKDASPRLKFNKLLYRLE